VYIHIHIYVYGIRYDDSDDEINLHDQIDFDDKKDFGQVRYDGEKTVL